MSAFRSDPPHLGESSLNPVEHHDQQIGDAEIDHDKLDHVGPDHRLDAAGHRVKRRADADDHHEPHDRNPGERSERDGRRIDHHADVERPHQQEETAADQPDAERKTLFEILIRRDDSEIQEETDKDEDDDRSRQKRRQIPDSEPLETVAEEVGRTAEDADRADQCGEDRHARPPPRDRVSGHEELLRVVLFVQELRRHQHESGEIDEQNQVIKPVESHFQKPPFGMRTNPMPPMSLFRPPSNRMPSEPSGSSARSE